MKVAPEVRAKDVKDYKIVGTSQKRIDLPSKLRSIYLRQRRRIPGMLHGRVVRPPTIASKPSSVDESSVRIFRACVKGVKRQLCRCRLRVRMGGDQSGASVKSDLVAASDENAGELQ